MVKILLNGDEREVSAENLTTLILDLGLDGRKIAVERNYEIVPRSTYLLTSVVEGDRFEIVHFVGGGD